MSAVKIATIPLLTILLTTCGMPIDNRSGTRTAEVTHSQIESTITATGGVAAKTQSKLNFRVNGVFTGYKAAVGDRVKAGQELATVDAPDQDAAVAQAEGGLANAQGAVKAAQAKVTMVQNGALPENVQQARAALATANAKLAAELAQGRPEDVASKQAMLDAAQARLQMMQNGSRAEDIAQAKATVDQAQAKLQALQNGPRSEQVAIYKTQVLQARNTLLSAQLTRDATCGLGRGSACDGANAQVNAAQDGVDLANQQLALNTAPPAATDMIQAQAAVTAAQRALDKTRTPYIEQELGQQRDAVLQAQQAVLLAQRPFTQHDIDQARAAVLSAEAALALAQKPYLPTDLEQAQAALEQTQATAQEAASQLRAAKQNQQYKSLVAPYDGVILSETANLGEIIGPNGIGSSSTAPPTSNAQAFGDPSIVMASDQGIRINANVDETDIDRIQVGQRVTIAFDAFPGKTFTGKVTFVPPLGNSVQNVQQYTAFISVDQDTDLLKPGMTANCAIVVDTKANALVVPTPAIQNVDGNPVVLIKQADGTSRQQEVQTGLNNPTTTEIVSGLQAGQTVVLGRVAPGPAKEAGK